MKRIVALCLTAILLLSIAACGNQTENALLEPDSGERTEPVTEPVTVETVGEYIIPDHWTERSWQNEGYGYVFEESKLPENLRSLTFDGTWYTGETQENGTNYIARYDAGGTESARLEIPPMSNSSEAEDSIGQVAFSEEAVWFVHSYTLVLDEENGEIEFESQLEKWSLDGTMLLTIPMDTFFPEMTDSVLTMAYSEKGYLLMTTFETMFFLGDSGDVLKEIPGMYVLRRDSSGRLYLQDDMAGALYTIDWDNLDVGTVVLSYEDDSNVCMGGGAYDFFLSSSTRLRGVSLGKGTITELLSWSDMNLAGSVSNVSSLDGETLEVVYFNMLTLESSYASLRSVPLEEIPEKATVTLAFGIGSAFEGMDWTEVMDSQSIAIINQFNRESSQYHVEVVPFTDATELQLRISSGESPDMIYWNGYSDSEPSAQMYARKGLLTDLESLMNLDPACSIEDFVPAIVAAERETYGGMYTIPAMFRFRTLTIPKEYEAPGEQWTLSNLESWAKSLPEDVVIDATTSQTGMLDTLLSSAVSDFADISTGVCDFENAEFYALLHFCRDHFLSDAEMEAMYASGETVPDTGILNYSFNIGSIAQYIQDDIRGLQDTHDFVGFPSTTGIGNGQLLCYGEMSICAAGQQQDGAWAFLKYLSSYDVQVGLSRLQCPVRQDALEAMLEKEKSYSWNDTTDAELDAFFDMMNHASMLPRNSPVVEIAKEEAEAFFAGDKTAEETARIIQNRVRIYLGEQA